VDGRKFHCRRPRAVVPGLPLARLAFLTPNFANLAFLRGSWRQKKYLALWLFLFNISIFLEAVGT